MEENADSKTELPAEPPAGDSPKAADTGNMLDRGLLIALVVVVLVVVFLCLRPYFQTSPNQPQPDAASTSTPELSHDVGHFSTNLGASWSTVDNPAADGWATEVFARQAKKQLETLGNWIVNPANIDATAVADLITTEFACEPLLPSDRSTVLEDEHFKIERAATRLPTPVDQPPAASDLTHPGPNGLVEAIRLAADPFMEATEVRFEVKVFRAVASQDHWATRQYFSISGRTKSGMIEQHATWDVGWAVCGGEGLPRMQWIRVVEFEQSASRQPSGTLFADCTASVLGGNQGYADQFLHGANHWFQRIQDPSRFALLANPGLAVGDVNGDGLDDLYVCQEAGLPNRLFIQQPDGSAREVSASWGVDWLESSRSALLVDLDNDSDQDLVVAILGGVVLAENDGQGAFLIRDVLASGEDTMSLSAVDYDLDGRLDIYVCVYFENRAQGNSDAVGLPGAIADFVVHDANNGGNNVLFHNQISTDGNWKFADVTDEAGLNANNHRYSLAASWDDFDNDGDQDLYVANDYGRDHFYRNDLIKSGAAETDSAPSPQFIDISDSAQVEDSAAGMSITWGDYDRDGWSDAFVSNMWSSAGKRIAFQSKFQTDASDEIRNRYQRLARGNTLLRNRGDGTFDNHSEAAGIEMGRWAWGSQFVDLNNDGWEDVFVSNGYITTPDSGDL